MIRVSQVKLPVGHTSAQLEQKLRKILKLQNDRDFSWKIEKRSLDARKKPELFFVYTLAVEMNGEESVVKKAHVPSVICTQKEHYEVPARGEEPLRHPPVIVGAGPAGLFAACILTEQGYAPIVLERGQKVEERIKSVQEFWDKGILDVSSNVQFGEGGAGAFSDGKLNTAAKDRLHRSRFVLKTFVNYGAPEEILYDARPHIGTDILSSVIVNMRKDLQKKGCTFYFNTRAEEFLFEKGRISQIVCVSPFENPVFEVDAAILAPGHSARDTFRHLYEKQLSMEAKNFAVGFRVEHPQHMIDEAQYGIKGGRLYGPENYLLPAAYYKVTANFSGGRGVYSFCMCPGGYVVNASSQKQRLAVNGMSYSARDGANANSAIIVSVGPADFGAADPLAGMRYQENLEERAFALGNGRIPQQLFGDYVDNTPTTTYGEFASHTKGGTVFANLRGLLSEEMEQAFIRGMNHFAHIVPNYDRKDSILSGVESRTSSPLRILRDENCQSSMQGLYPCGEGAGYAGGIMSAAMDGMKAAEALIRRYRPRCSP